MNKIKSLFVCIFFTCTFEASAPDQESRAQDTKELYDQVISRASKKSKGSGVTMDKGVEYVYSEVTNGSFFFRITVSTKDPTIDIFFRVITKDSSEFFAAHTIGGTDGLIHSGEFTCLQSEEKMNALGACTDGGKSCCSTNINSWQEKYNWAIRESLKAFHGEATLHGNGQLTLVSK